MTYAYVFDPVAASEFEEAFGWYESKSTTAADGFIVAVHDAIHLACENPDRFRNTYTNLR